MVKVNLDEKKNRILIKRKAREIALRPYFEDTISYKEMKEELDEKAPMVIGGVIIVGALFICYVCIIFLIQNYFGSANPFELLDVNIMIVAIGSLSFGTILGYLVMLQYPQQKVERNYDMDYALTVIDIDEKS